MSDELPSGMQGIIRQVIKLLGLQPEKIEKQISDFAQIMLNIDARLTAISDRLAVIEKHLGIPQPEPKDLNNERQNEGSPKNH